MSSCIQYTRVTKESNKLSLISVFLILNHMSGVLLWCQIWIVNYHVKCFSDKWSVSRFPTKNYQENHLGILIYILSWKHLYEIYSEEKQQTKTTIFWQIFDVSVFDVVKGLQRICEFWLFETKLFLIRSKNLKFWIRKKMALVVIVRHFSTFIVYYGTIRLCS